MDCHILTNIMTNSWWWFLFFIRDAIYIVRSVEAQSKHNRKQYPPYTLGVFKRQPDKTKPSTPRLVVREYSTFVIPEGDLQKGTGGFNPIY